MMPNLSLKSLQTSTWRSLTSETLHRAVIPSLYIDVAYNAWWLVGFLVDVEGDAIRFVVWHVLSNRQIKGHVKEVCDFFVGFDCYFEAMLAEDIAKIFLNFIR